jgi:hypothetical protein
LESGTEELAEKTLLTGETASKISTKLTTNDFTKTLPQQGKSLIFINLHHPPYHRHNLTLKAKI